MLLSRFMVFLSSADTPSEDMKIGSSKKEIDSPIAKIPL